MKTSRAMKIFGMSIILGAIWISGCYTVLMHPSVLTSSEKEYSSQEPSHGDFTSDISYSSNCLSCHSQAELDDRYFDMNQAGIHYVHGISIDPYGWQRPATSLPWWDGVFVPMTPTAVSSSQPAPASGPRRRETGSTRGSDRTRATPAPADQTSTSSTAPSTPTAVSDTRSNTSTSTQSSPTERTRSTSTPAKEAPARKSGSRRGDDPK